MSGIEVAGLVFGVLPVIAEVIKSYSSIISSLHTFRHYSGELKSVALKFKVQRAIFFNEVRHILGLVQDDKEIERMLEDQTHPRWANKELDDRLSAILRNSLDLCHSIIKDTSDSIEGMKEEMAKFEVLLQMKSQNEPVKTAIKRLRGAIKITLDKPNYEKRLANLRENNTDLGRLRAQIGQFQQQNTNNTNTSNNTSIYVTYKTLPSQYRSIQDASQKLHETLCNSWCCDDVAHQCHYVKLCLGAEAQSEVRLDLAISCDVKPAQTNGSRVREPPIWLYVQSKSVELNACTETTGSKHGDSTLDHTTSATSVATSTEASKRKASSSSAESCCKKKSKRVRFGIASDAQIPAQIPVQISATVSQHIAEFNLCQSKNICDYLQRQYLASKTAPENRSFGYLETPQSYKHMFFFRDTKNWATQLKSPPKEHVTLYSLYDAMEEDVEDVLKVEDQLRLAHKTAVALLQYKDTPWLPERWRLGDVSYLGSQNNLDEAALNTLHFSSQISASHKENVIEMGDAESSKDTATKEEIYGINNTSLFCLGMALLEIAHWKPIEQKMQKRDGGIDIVASRRLANGRAPLGPEYQKIVQKCLQCNFGFGTDLGKKSLQTAVYNDVVCELERMTQSLTV